MKVISFSIFGEPRSFEFNFYLRGLYYNARMARLLYPDWKVQIYAARRLFDNNTEFFIDLDKTTGSQTLDVNLSEDRCSAMLWRMQPLFLKFPEGEVTHVICRDADAVLTYKESQSVNDWVNSGYGFHGITDDPAHTIPIMGGMFGVMVDHFKSMFPEYNTFEKLINGANLKNHGSDQDLLMKRIYPKARRDMLGHFFKGCNDAHVLDVRRSVDSQIIGVSKKLWESNLTCRMIGSPGVVDFELLRFFKRFDNNPKFDEFERKFKDICYWQR